MPNYEGLIDSPTAKAFFELVKDKNVIEVVELWVGNESHLEILRTDGYYDTIYFEDKDKADEVYNILKVYNRDITPLEKYHASF